MPNWNLVLEEFMGLREEQRVIGREGVVRINELEISVIIRDVRLKPYAMDYLVEPTAGEGLTWVDGYQVRILGWTE
jgi:hypothetical protein